MFNMLGSDGADEAPSRQQMIDYLNQGDPAYGFASLGPDLQAQILAALGQMDGMQRSEMLRRLREMGARNREQVVGEIVHTGSGAHQQAPQGDTKHYRVKPGDTLTKISRAYNVGLKALIAANPQIKNPDLIYPDQVINLP